MQGEFLPRDFVGKNFETERRHALGLQRELALLRDVVEEMTGKRLPETVFRLVQNKKDQRPLCQDVDETVALPINALKDRELLEAIERIKNLRGILGDTISTRLKEADAIPEDLEELLTGCVNRGDTDLPNNISCLDEVKSKLQGLKAA